MIAPEAIAKRAHIINHCGKLATFYLLNGHKDADRGFAEAVDRAAKLIDNIDKPETQSEGESAYSDLAAF
jgi:hypothetical protein